MNETPFNQVEGRLEEFGISAGEEFWNLVRANLDKFADVAGWSTALYAPMAGRIDPEDREFCAMAADCLPETLSDTSWSEWTAELKLTSGRKGKQLFMPLRLALTGRQRGPEMGPILKILGSERAKKRLQGLSG